jgi:hypothetical protein
MWFARDCQATLKLAHVIPALNETSRNRGEAELRRYLVRRAEAEFAILMDRADFRGELLIRGGNIPGRLAETAREPRCVSADCRPRPHTKGPGTPAHAFAGHHPRVELSGHQRLSYHRPDL